MRQQQSVKSLWLASLTGVLITQTAWANPVPSSTTTQLKPAQSTRQQSENSNQTPSNVPTAPPSNSDLLTPSTQVPTYLKPNPNPLLFPTQPEEVQIQRTQLITLEQAFDVARQNNRQVQVAELTVERNRAALREAQAALYPNLNLNTDFTRQQSASGEIQAQSQTSQFFSSTDEPSTSFNGNLQLSYDLFTSGDRTARIRAAEEQLRFNQLDLERLLAQTRLDVANDYYELQRQDEQVRINGAAVTNAQASLRDAQALEQAGVGTRFDVLRAQVNLADAIQELTNSQSEQQIARRRLANRLSLPQSFNLAAADPVEIAGLWNLPLEQSIILAFQNRAELEQQLAQRNINNAQRSVALAAIRPQVSIIASYNVLDEFNDDVSLADGTSLGARVTWNLFDGGAARARATQEEANIAIAETRFAEQRNQVRFEVEQAYTQLSSNLENIQTASVALTQARESLRLARLRFQAGVGTQTDVISAENDLTRAEGNRVNAILDYNRAFASLQRALSADLSP